MPYEFNPLIPDGFQKKSAVTPADITRVESEISDLQNTTTDLKQKKVTKFFSANDYLEDNEIAQFQGEDDAVNNLQNGFFYKKNPAFTITQNSDTFNYNVGRKVNWYLRNNTLKVTQYYLSTIQTEYNDFYSVYDSVRDIEVIFFAETYAKSPALKTAVRQGRLYYPFAIVNNQFDFDNPVQIIGEDYYYKGVIINFNQSSGGVPAMLCASMEAPNYRYLWLPVITSGKWWWAAFLYETNSMNEFVILGVDNNLSAFDICRYEYEYIIPTITINAHGYQLIANQPFSQTNSQPAGVTQQEFNELKSLIGTNTSVHDENNLRTAEYSIYYLLNNFALVSGRCTFKESISGGIDPLFQFPFTLSLYAISVTGNMKGGVVTGQVFQNGEIYMSGSYTAGKYFDFCFILPISQN